MGFFSNIGAALWMLIGHTKAFSLVRPTFPQFVLFLVTALSANVLFAWLIAPADSYFNEQGLVSYLVWPMVILVAGIILAKRSLNYALLFVPVILWLVADTLLVLFQSGVQFLENKGWLPHFLSHISTHLFVALFVWQSISLLWIFAKRLHWPWWERCLMIGATVFLLVVWQNNISAQPIFKAKPVETLLDETVFYEQPELLNKSLNNIAQSKKGEHEWYFLGVAGYADQDVFASEVLQARHLFDARFGTAKRSVALINNAHTWMDYPIASRFSIQRSLMQIGHQMDREEDVLFMLLSSHGVVDESGEPTGELAMVNKPLDFHHIYPDNLKSALDKSGIRWRVIVISACYSGRFIDSLKDPYTLIITASRADRASFGCTNDADMSYFGRAFFEESLRQSSSFQQAFNSAVMRVSEREILQNFQPSEPQMYIGEAMQLALPELEKALFQAGQKPEIQLPYEALEKLEQAENAKKP